MFKKAQESFNFYETPTHHSMMIYNDCNPSDKLKVIDICCGLGSLVQPWYDNGHDVTLVELNEDFIPLLKDKFPKAKVISIDYLTNNIDEQFDVYLCNPPFNTNDEKKIYVSFFCKILMTMTHEAVLYFICPKMFYKNQNRIKIENEFTSTFSLIEYIKQTNDMPAKYYFDKYGVIELHSNEFTFNKQMLKRMKGKGIISDDFIDEDDNMITPYFEFRYLGNILDFKETQCKYGLFKVNS